MAAQGWIKLHRTLAENDLWDAEPFTWGQAWVDLLMHANHKPTAIFIRGVQVDLDRGDIGWSEITMSKRWKWSRGKVRRYLGMLKTRQMIVQQTTQVTSIVSICNYSVYQGEEGSDGTPNGTADGTPGGTPDGTPNGTQKKNVKNGKKGNGSQASRGITFDAWIDQIRDVGEKPIPDDHVVIRFAQEAGIPHEFLAVCWEHFKGRYSGDSKTYIDWRKVFHNSVRENWFKIWWHDGSGYQLTTVGQQGMNALNNKIRESA